MILNKIIIIKTNYLDKIESKKRKNGGGGKKNYNNDYEEKKDEKEIKDSLTSTLQSSITN